MKFWNKLFFLFSALLLLLNACTEDVNTLDVSTNAISIEAEGGTSSFTINTDAPEWKIDNPASDWIILSSTSGTSSKAMVSLTIASKTVEVRSAQLTITAGNAHPLTIEVTQASSEFIYALTSNLSSLTVKQSGGSSTFTVTTTAPQWEITCDAGWITINPETSTDPTQNVTVTAIANETSAARSATLTISAQYAPTKTIIINQNGEIYPSYNTSPIAADNIGMESTASQLAKNMYAGWNLGNSLEAPGSETSWGNPKTTKAFIDSVKAAGFNAVRIPCAWNSYIENTVTCKLKDSWLARVKEVVDYCIDNEMYVVVNIHWDGGWLENNCTTAKQEENNAKQKAIWEQIAMNFRDYGEHLLFAGTNEPNVSSATEMAVLLSYEQTFIDAVRSTGGRNAYRVLIFQGPSTDIEKTNTLMKTLPSDKVSNRLMAEVHYYTPWNFCGLEADASWGKMFYYWGANYHSTTDTDRNANWGEEATVDQFFALMKSKFSNNGIPIILGEYGAIRRSNLSGDALTNHLASRAYYLKYVTRQAKTFGMVPFYWDNGGTGTNGFALFNRNTKNVFDSQALDALMEGAEQGEYPY